MNTNTNTAAGGTTSIGPRRVVISGANRGLGLALTRAFCGVGDEVVAGCRRPDEAQELAATGARVVALDTADAASIASFCAAIGSAPVDVLVNNAGIDARALGAPDGERSALQLSAAHFEGVLAVNVTGPLLMVQGLAGNLRAAAQASGMARLVNVSSQIGSFEVAQRTGRDVSYAVSKAALNMLTLKQSQVLGPDGVVSVMLHPGWLRTDMGGASAELEAADAAASIVATIGALGAADNGRFLRWDGTEHPF